MSELAPGELKKLDKGKKVGTDLTLYAGRVMPSTFGEVMDFAQMMCKGENAIPKHLRDKPGACLSIIQRSMAWEMDPWAVASKTYLTSDDGILSYEAQLIAAVVMKWAPVKEKVWSPKYEGEGENRKCVIVVHHVETGEEYRYESPIIGKQLGIGEDGSKTKTPPTGYVGIWPKNSPLWRHDPDQQLWYYSIRAMARRFWPGIILGVYDREEALQMAMKDVTPAKTPNFLDEPVEETGEGEVLEPAKTGFAKQVARDSAALAETMTAREVAREIPHNPETGELEVEEVTLADAYEGRGFNPVTGLDRGPGPEPDDEETTITPELIAQNMVKSINGATDKVRLETWHKENAKDMNALPPDLLKGVRKALDDRHLELAEF